MDLNTFLTQLEALEKQAIVIAKKCYIFRASSAYNCQHITSLINYLRSNQNIQLEPTYSQTFAEVLTIVEDFIGFLGDLSEDKWLNTLMQWNDDKMLSFTEVFPQRLEESVSRLGINTAEAIPTTNEQKIVNKKSDLSKIRKNLLNWLNNPANANSPKREDVKQKLDGITEVEGDKSEFEKKLVDFKSVNINNDDIELDNKAADNHLGAGGFGIVCKATRLSTAEFVAVKEIRRDKLSPSSWNSIFAEIVSMNKLHHPYVLELVGAHIVEPYRIITRFCSGRSLFDRLHRRSQLPPLTETDLTKIAYQVASGMEYLHKNKIVHRDLKTLNILLDGNGNACIADFGLSGTMNSDEGFGETVGTPHYTAPEVLAHAHYGPKVDIYSFAIVLWEMLTKEVPFSDKLPYSIYDHVVTCGWRLPIPNESAAAAPELCKLITQCWSKDPNDRPDFSVIVPLFEDGSIKFPDSKPIDYTALKKEIHCPPLNVPYALSVMKNIDNPHFGSVTKFVAERVDSKLAETLVKENILDYMLKSKDNYDSILLLASKLLKDSDGFSNFINGGGLNMLKETISQGVLNGALKFGIALPSDLTHCIDPFLPKIIYMLKQASEELTLTIFMLIKKFPDGRIREFQKDICGALPTAAKVVADPKNRLSTEENFQAVIALFIVCYDGFQDSDVTVFYPLISEIFKVSPDFVSCLESISKEENYPLFVLHILKALKKTDLTSLLIHFLEKKEKICSTLFRKLSEIDECYDTLTELLSDEKLLKEIIAPLLVFFEIAQIKEAAIKIAYNEKLLSALLDMTTNHGQRLQILTALTSNEEFCKETQEMDNIIHLLASDLMDERYRDYSIRLISAMSAHKTGCDILSDNGVFLPFAQLFLSSSLGDSSAAYTILRNAAKFGAQIPQVPLIVSCLMQTTMFEMARKNEILDTLIALVQNMQGSVQEHDLKTIILPQFNREGPQVVYRSLMLFAVCDPNKLSSSTVEELLSAINEILNDQQKMYPCIIEAAVRALNNLSLKNPLTVFFEGTGFIKRSS